MAPPTESKHLYTELLNHNTVHTQAKGSKLTICSESFESHKHPRVSEASQ